MQTAFLPHVVRVTMVFQDIYILGRMNLANGSWVSLVRQEYNLHAVLIIFYSGMIHFSNYLLRDGDTGEWGELGGGIVLEHEHSWYASAKIPDSWFKC